MHICKMTQDVKYVQFKGHTIELINNHKYGNSELVEMYPSFFVSLEEIKAQPKEVINEVIPEVAPEVIAPEVKEVEVPKNKKKKLLVEDSSDVVIEVSEDTSTKED